MEDQKDVQKKDRETGALFGELFPFGGKLDGNNRWMKISKLVPWDDLEEKYASSLSRVGRPAHDARLVLGMLMLKHMTNLSDEEMKMELSENIYMQLFCGFDHFVTDEMLDSSTLTKVRQRLGVDFFRELESLTYAVLVERGIIRGKGMFCDATVVPEKIAYPNDVGILNKCREKLVSFVKKNGKAIGKTFRMYNRKAKKLVLSFCKKKNKTKKLINKTKKKLLNFVNRNIRQAEETIIMAKERGKELVFKEIEVIKEIFRQQKVMYVNRVNRIEERIVSIARPYVRPIKRGKEGKDVEFGTKGAFHYVNGFLFLDHLEHENFNEAKDEIVKKQLENFEKRFGVQPMSFTGDNIYGTRNNRKLLEGRNVRVAFKPLGRKSVIKSLSDKKWFKKKHRERNRIEGSFGHGKEHGGLKPIRYKSPEGAEMWVRLGLLGMNLRTAVAKI